MEDVEKHDKYLDTPLNSTYFSSYDYYYYYYYVLF